MWVPECAFYPGLDEVLAEAGIRYFLVDSHGIEHADPRPLFGVNAPLYCPSGVAAFGRHPTTSKLVWSTSVGYPADYNYREYYRDIGFDLDQDYLEPFQYAKGVRTHTGIKYHRITGPDRGQAPVQPGLGARTRPSATPATSSTAAATRPSRAGSRMPFPAVIVSPYDAELFGHWWFEGPQWIYHVLRELSARRRPGAGHAGRVPERAPDPAEGDAGAEQLGHERLQRALGQPQDRLDVAAAARGGGADAPGGAARTPAAPHGSLEDRALRQAGRELMLAQASDWPFIITNGTTEEYARRRFHDHLNRFHYLLHGLEHRADRRRQAGGAGVHGRDLPGAGLSPVRPRGSAASSGDTIPNS